MPLLVQVAVMVAPAYANVHAWHALQVGWKHQDAVAELEEKRKVKSAAYYQAKKKLIALKAKAAAEAEA